MLEANESAMQVDASGVELTLSAVKEFLVSNGGKVRYADLYNRFRDLIIDSSSGIMGLFFYG